MKVTPLDLKKPDFTKEIRGFKKEEVHNLLAAAADTLEENIRENMELKTQLAEFKERLKNYVNMENTLNETLIMAQKTSESSRRAAEREAEMIVAKAEVQAEKMLEETRAKLKNLKSEIEMLKQEKNLYIVRMRSLVASQWKLLQGEWVDRDVSGEAGKDARQPQEAETGGQQPVRKGRAREKEKEEAEGPPALEQETADEGSLTHEETGGKEPAEAAEMEAEQANIPKEKPSGEGEEAAPELGKEKTEKPGEAETGKEDFSIGGSTGMEEEKEDKPDIVWDDESDKGKESKGRGKKK